jgi:hypothetical protein
VVTLVENGYIRVTARNVDLPLGFIADEPREILRGVWHEAFFCAELYEHGDGAIR